MKIFNLKRKPTHPGEVLREEYLNELKISQSKLAKDIDVSFVAINEIVNEKRGISHEMALKLSKYFNTSIEFWINLQLKSDLYKIMQNQKLMNKIDNIKPISQLV